MDCPQCVWLAAIGYLLETSRENCPLRRVRIMVILMDYACGFGYRKDVVKNDLRMVKIYDTLHHAILCYHAENVKIISAYIHTRHNQQ